MNKKHVIGYTVTALLALTIGAAGASGSSTAPVAAKSVPAATVTVSGPVVTVPGPAVTLTVAAPAPKAAAKPAPAPATIEEGQWEVGVDVPAGVYKVTAAVDPGAQCYWSITQHGSPDNIIDNDIVAGGKPTVTLKRGQDFTTQGCGLWAKVK
jgi:hypothetical protein